MNGDRNQPANNGTTITNSIDNAEPAMAENWTVWLQEQCTICKFNERKRVIELFYILLLCMLADILYHIYLYIFVVGTYCLVFVCHSQNERQQQLYSFLDIVFIYFFSNNYGHTAYDIGIWSCPICSHICWLFRMFISLPYTFIIFNLLSYLIYRFS